MTYTFTDAIEKANNWTFNVTEYLIPDAAIYEDDTNDNLTFTVASEEVGIRDIRIRKANDDTVSINTSPSFSNIKKEGTFAGSFDVDLSLIHI